MTKVKVSAPLHGNDPRGLYTNTRRQTITSVLCKSYSPASLSSYPKRQSFAFLMLVALATFFMVFRVYAPWMMDDRSPASLARSGVVTTPRVRTQSSTSQEKLLKEEQEEKKPPQEEEKVMESTISTKRQVEEKAQQEEDDDDEDEEKAEPISQQHDAVVSEEKKESEQVATNTIADAQQQAIFVSPRVVRLLGDDEETPVTTDIITGTAASIITPISKNRTVVALNATFCCNEYTAFYKRQSEILENHKDCQPQEEWQTQNYPTCNLVHEMDMNTFWPNLLGVGFIKAGWSLHEEIRIGRNATQHADLVFRTMRPLPKGRDPTRFDTPMVMEQNRLESLALERLTSNKRVINEYGYCGTAFISEMGKTTLQAAYYTNDTNVLNNTKRLELGVQVAAGMSDIHSVDTPEDARPTLTHGDFGATNILVTADDRVVMNDFSEGLAIYYDNTKNRTCRIAHWQAPTTLALDSRPPERFDPDGSRRHTGHMHWEKVDVYAMGIILLELLLGRERPFESELGEQTPLRIQPRVLPLPQYFYESRETAVLALLYAALSCFSFEPDHRPTAYRVRQGLETALTWITRDGKWTSTVDEIKALFQGAIDDDHFAGIKLAQ